MNLCGAVDTQDGDFAVFAEFRRGVRLALYFFVDFGAGGEESRVGEEVFGGVGGE